jgi:hypothetical protein
MPTRLGHVQMPVRQTSIHSLSSNVLVDDAFACSIRSKSLYSDV